jgi:LPXTG-motif cell wall-anchored protein
MTQAEMSAVSWILLAGMPGAVLLMGLLVAVRRRK